MSQEINIDSLKDLTNYSIEQLLASSPSAFKGSLVTELEIILTKSRENDELLQKKKEESQKEQQKEAQLIEEMTLSKVHKMTFEVCIQIGYGSNIFMAGSFNEWKATDQFIMKCSDSKYWRIDFVPASDPFWKNEVQYNFIINKNQWMKSGIRKINFFEILSIISKEQADDKGLKRHKGQLELFEYDESGQTLKIIIDQIKF